MGIYHLQVKMIGRGKGHKAPNAAAYRSASKVRSTGKSAVAAAAYRAGQKLENHGQEIEHDFSKKEHVLHSEIMLPEFAPEQFADRETLWNAVEAVSIRKDAQLAREVEIALPRELSDADNIALARKFAQESFVDWGMCADVCIHKPLARDGLEQPHAHIMLTTREVDESGFGKVKREWASKEMLCEWRQRWAEMCNEQLAELGIHERIDHRSYKERGIELEPMIKEGRAAFLDQPSDRIAHNEAIRQRNVERLLEQPEIALAALTEHAPAFHEQQMTTLIGRYATSKQQHEQMREAILDSADVEHCGTDRMGRVWLTTRELAQEAGRFLGRTMELGRELWARIRGRETGHELELGQELGDGPKSRKLDQHLGFGLGD